MEANIIEKIINNLSKFFSPDFLPVTFEYTDNEVTTTNLTGKSHCMIKELNSVFNGNTLSFSINSIHCGGGRAYCGFSPIASGIAKFLSTGKELYKKSPELASKEIENAPFFNAPKPFITFKRIDKLTKYDNPEAVIFFANPDELSGLFTWAGFDSDKHDYVVTPFGSGCGLIISYPYLEQQKNGYHSYLGMFDPSARPHFDSNKLSFSIPFNRFLQMIENINSCFFITETWNTVQKRINK
jgi:hypothetical protein